MSGKYVFIDGVSGLTLALADTSSPANGAGLSGYGYDQAYAARTVGGRLRDFGVFASDIPGYDPTGVADSTTAINTAYSAAVARGLYTVYLTGTPLVSGANPFPFTVRLAFVGVGGGDAVFSNDLTKYPVRMLCGGVTTYLFDQPDVANGSGSLVLQNIAFDGTVAGGTGRSTTWLGLVKSAAASNNFYLTIENCAAGKSDSATAILGLNGQVFANISHFYGVLFPFGYGIQCGAGGLITTTITFNKCYFSNLRQWYEVTSNVTDVTFNDCAAESCVVLGAVYAANVTENNSYHENIGYDGSGTGITTGLTARSFGVADAPAIAGNVVAAYTCRFGQMVFNEMTIQATTGGKKWFDGIGRSASGLSGGAIVLNNLILAAGTLSTIFAADGDTPSSRFDFEYHVTTRFGQTGLFTAADARMVTRGRLPIAWSDGNARPVEIDNGIFTMPSVLGGLIALPTIAPSGGTNSIGDRIRMATSQFVQGVRTSYRCVVGGSAAASRWNIDEFIPSSLSGNVVNAGTLVVSAVANDNPGEQHVWEIMASTGANIESHYRVTMQAFSGAGQLSTQAIVVTKTLTFTMGWAATYTITITNTSGSTLNIYARLVSVTSAHA